MFTFNINEIQVRQFNRSEELPYELLLLADPSLSHINTYIHNSDIFIAWLHGDIIGVYVLCILSEECIEIKNIAVDIRFQGKGVGKYLLTDASYRSRDNGFKNIMIGTANSSIAQLKLYQQQGFEITGIKKNYFIQNYPEIIYENGIVARHMLMMTKAL